MTPNTTEKRRDTDATAAVVLAVVLLVCPVMADVAAVSIAMQKYWFVAIWVLTCYGIVVFPWVRSLLRHRREPDVWDGQGKLQATGVILGIHALWIGFGAMHWCVSRWSS